jgi:hypothetical protein
VMNKSRNSISFDFCFISPFGGRMKMTLDRKKYILR